MDSILNRKVLVLNQSYEPLMVINAKRAIILVLKEKVELLEKYANSIRTVSASFDFPSVVRLNFYVRIKYKDIALNRKNLLKRDNNRCQYCNSPSIPLTIDHIVPRNKGGQDTWENLVAACVKCNTKKGNYFLKEICQSDRILPGTKLWIEVPDFEWIVKNGVFYDITYEHCNYFTKPALANLLNKLGFAIRSFKNVFDGQYLLVEAIFQQEEFTDQKIGTYSLSIQNIDRVFEGNKKRFQKLVEEGESVCVWGASGKGVIFLSELNDIMLRKIKYVVDINREKQGKFLPVTAKEIKPPESLKGIDSSLSVLIMNGMYSQEIQQTLQSMNINFQTHVI